MAVTVKNMLDICCILYASAKIVCALHLYIIVCFVRVIE